MSESIIECVPNISEGTDLEKVERIIAGVRDVEGVTLVGCESDADHNRSVITLAGNGDALVEAAFRIYKAAKDEIDLNKHLGEHPRMGAVDVCPFIPVADATMEQCVACAEKLAERVGKELELPIYLYESAARREDRKNLATIRKGQFEKLKDLIGKDEDRVPDFGPNAIHPTFGCSAIGARFFLIAYNVNLNSDDVALAKTIGKTVREKDGGMKAVKGMGFEIQMNGKTYGQVSMNLVDYRETSPALVYKRIEELAAEQSVDVLESELIGVMPQATVDLCAEQLGINESDAGARADAVAKALKIKGWKREMVLENNL